MLFFSHLWKRLYFDMEVWKIQANSFNQLAYECSKNEINGLLHVNTYKMGVIITFASYLTNCWKNYFIFMSNVLFKKCSVGQLHESKMHLSKAMYSMVLMNNYHNEVPGEDWGDVLAKTPPPP